MCNRKKKYNDWVDKACALVDKVGSTLNLPVGAMQSDITKALDNDINIMFLGHDAHETNPDFKYENSDYFRDRCNHGNINWGARNTEWAIWRNLRNYFINVVGDSFLMDDMEHLVFTNAIFFTGDRIHEVLEQIGTSVENKCMELTRELVFEILQPKLLVCFSVGDVFDKLIGSIKKKEGANVKMTVNKFKPYHIKYNCAITQFNRTIILGIPHPSGAYGVLASLPAVVRIINDLSKGVEIEKVVATKDLFLDSQEKNETNSRTFQLKIKIDNNGAIQKIYDGRILFHEYFTTIKNGKYVNSPERIVIDLMPEEDKNQYAVLVFTRQNDETKTKDLIKGIWPNEEFNPWTENKSRHIHKIISFNESDEHIKEIMEQVLYDVKTYRNKTFPLKK